MHVLTIAVGAAATTRAAGLAASLAPTSLQTVSDADLLPAHNHPDPRRAARRAKAGFASYLPALASDEPVLLLDADLVANVPDAIARLAEACEGAVMGGVSWSMPGVTVHLPAPFENVAVEGLPLNSGLLWCADTATAASLCAAWSARYVESEANSIYKDEPALAVALVDLQSLGEVRRLPATFNARSWAGAVFAHAPYCRDQRSRPAPIPHEVPMWAIRAVLDLAGLTESVDASLAQLPEPAKTIAQRVWEYGNYIRRDSPTIAQLTVALDKTDAEVDDYFRRASTLNP
jgi:hypothetical protein